MKILLIAFILLPMICFSQEKKDTRIIVAATDTTNLFNRIVFYLYEQGYSLERKDEAVGFLQTDEREMKKVSVLYKIKVLVNNGTMTFTSSIKIPALGDKAFSDTFYTKGDSFYRMSWDITKSIAENFGSLTYGK
jgi:hypothetical protein